jgi:sugar lactone lactonase YvrE
LSSVDATHLSWPQPAGGYGIAIDAQGRVFTCHEQIARFDPDTESWTVAEVSAPWGAGCMVDDDDRLWIGTKFSRLRAIDTESLVEVKDILLPDFHFPYGVSIDFEGYIWAVDTGGILTKVNPETEGYEFFDGLDYTYTYSDMTGFALQHAGVTPVG